jgi:hypothetical protein
VWMLPLLLPVGLLGTVVLISLPGVFALLLTVIWGWLVFPCVAVFVRARSRVGGDGRSGNYFRDGEPDYWRTRLM